MEITQICTKWLNQKHLHFHRNQTFQSLFPLSFEPDASEALYQDSEVYRMPAAREDRQMTDHLFGKQSDLLVGSC